MCLLDSFFLVSHTLWGRQQHVLSMSAECRVKVPQPIFHASAIEKDVGAE